jgi:cardiolipin synthase
MVRLDRPMRVYRLADLLEVPNLLSLARVPLAIGFARARTPRGALAVLCAAGLTDMLDGWYARRFDAGTPTGALLDPITDKLFVGTVVGTLLRRGQLPLWSLALLGARELGELPLLGWFALRRDARAKEQHANVIGKAATTLQFAAVTAAVFRSRAFVPLAVVTGVAGALAAASYWRRWLRPT